MQSKAARAMPRRFRWIQLMALLPGVACSDAVGAAGIAGAAERAIPEMVDFSDDFASGPFDACVSEGQSHYAWNVVFDGYGCVSARRDGTSSWLRIAPRAVSQPSATSAPLVTGPEFGAEVDVRMRVLTERQLRTGAAPNAWEVGWVIWHYTDPGHFYYFIPKPNGWELGKRDPAYPGGQRFLATGSAPTYPPGEWIDVRIVQRGAAIVVSANGRELTRFIDEERPYLEGRIGLYSEDAAVRFTGIRARGTQLLVE